jgi:hypothetical protein
MPATFQAPEGVVISSRGLPDPFVDYGYTFGGTDYTSDGKPAPYPNEVITLSKTQLETLDLISEGLIAGLASGEYTKSGVVGEVGWRSSIFSGYNTPVGYENLKMLKSIYWNEIPVLSDSAQLNFQNISVAQTPGYPNGEVIQVLSPFQTVSRTIGERLRGGRGGADPNYAKVYRISNRDCRGAVINIKFPQLYVTWVAGSVAGSVGRTRVDYSISYRAFYNNAIPSDYILVKNVTVYGKITSAGGYIKTDRVDFATSFISNPDFLGWEIKILRGTPDSIDSNTVDATYVDSITEIQGNIYTFPNSALVRSLFDAEYFASVPERAYDTNLLKVKVPANYNPITKNYHLYADGIAPNFPIPVAYWNMDGNSRDMTNTYHGTDTSISYVDGKFGQGANFNGTTSKISFGPITTTTTFTLSMWVYPIPSSDAFGNLFGQDNAVAGIWYNNSSKTIDFGYSAATHFSNTPLIENDWNHVVITCNAGNVTFYLNGSADGTAVGATSFNAESMGNNAGSDNFKGRLDEIGLWNVVLTEAQITNLYYNYWNGDFSSTKKWTDNPAWCYYDLLTNKRYGLGRYIDSNAVDVTALYDIGKYCDTLVADGYGGLEPRFTCNTWFTSREEAYKVVNDMASIFLGMTYYSNGTIYVSQDSPKTPIITFTNANVEDGNFNYSTTSKKSRSSVAIVRYNDPKNFYRPSVEYIDDIEQIRKYGIREVELTAFGCTSRGQALRMGRWVLLSDKLEPESVNFVAGIGEAAYLKPGDIFKIHDTNKKLKRYGGRTISVTGKGNNTTSEFVLDGKIDVEPTIEYKLSLLTPSYNYNTSQVSGLNSNDSSGIRRPFIQDFYITGSQAVISGNKTVINFSGGIDSVNYKVSNQQVWTLELSDRFSSYSGNIYFLNKDEDYYRVINIEEKDINKFNIAGMQYNVSKYGEIESGLVFQTQQNNTINFPASPRNLSLNFVGYQNNIHAITYSFLIDSLNYVDTFKIYIKSGAFSDNNIPPNQYLVDSTFPNTNGIQYVTDTANYNFRIYAYNSVQSVYSPNFASGAINVWIFNPVSNIIISNLQVAK